ncbi:MAG TPA: hypothetical protein VF155_00780 [Candidatus Dormibacteraeota bacterium]
MATETSIQAPPPQARGWRRHRRAGLAIVVVAVLAVAAAFVVGVTGLFANPVQSVNGDGTTTLQGEFEPYQCGSGHCEGYIQAGARSVFVRFPDSCPAPARAAQITVRGRPAPDLGTGAYRAESCARPV